MKANVWDEELEAYKSVLREEIGRIKSFTGQMKPLHSKKLSDEEESTVYDNPIALYPDEEITNAEAAGRLLQEMGPKKYVDWVTKMVRKKESGGLLR